LVLFFVIHIDYNTSKQIEAQSLADLSKQEEDCTKSELLLRIEFVLPKAWKYTANLGEGENHEGN